MTVRDTIDSAVSTASNAASRNPWIGVAGAGMVGAGLGYAGNHILNKVEGSADLTPDDIRRRSIRRAIMMALGTAGAAGVATYAAGDRTGYENGVWQGTKQLIHSIMTPEWRAKNPLANAKQHASDMHSLPAPYVTGTNMSEPIMKQAFASLVSDDDQEDALEKFASSLYFQDTIPLQMAVGTLMTDPHLNDRQRYGMSNLFVDSAMDAQSPMFSGAQLARTAVKSGLGAVEGYGFGKAFGTIFALPPKQVTMLSRSGAIAGAAFNSGLFR